MNLNNVNGTVFPSVYLSNSLPINDREVCCGFFDTFDDEGTFFALAAAASLYGVSKTNREVKVY